MCTAYEVGGSGGKIPLILKVGSLNPIDSFGKRRLIRPTIPAPVFLADGSGIEMSWGFRRKFAPKAKGGKPTLRTIVNSREDKLDGRTWRKAFEENRCIIPASAFFEWVERGGKNVPLRFVRPDGKWLWIAGIWEASEEHGDCFSMITTEPNGVLAPVHDRMPAVLTTAQIEPYLSGNLNEFGPSAVKLEYTEAENFLTKKKAKEYGDGQGDLL